MPALAAQVAPPRRFDRPIGGGSRAARHAGRESTMIDHNSVSPGRSIAIPSFRRVARVSNSSRCDRLIKELREKMRDSNVMRFPAGRGAEARTG